MPHRARLLVCLLLVGLAGGCAGQQGGDVAAPAPAPGGGEWRTDGCATARSPVKTHTAGVDMPLTNEQVQQLTTKVSQAGEARFGAVYAGLELTPDQVRVVVYRKPSAELDAYLRTVAGGECVIVRDAPHSQAELAALADRITKDMPYWRGRGIAINTVGRPEDGSGVKVGTENVAAARAELPRRYGAAIPIEVVQEGPVEPLVGR
jgi:hypothetical protein